MFGGSKRYGRNGLLAIALLFVLACPVIGCSVPVHEGSAASGSATADSAAIEGAQPFSQLRSLVCRDNASEFDYSQRALEYLEVIGERYPNRSAADAASEHDAAGDWIISELRAAGYADGQIEEQRFRGDSMLGGEVSGRNIVLTVPGSDESLRIVVGAHYDGTGVGDNGSGTALLLATAVGMHDITPAATVQFVFFDCEEDGLLGSNYHAGQMTEDEVAQTAYMINLDSLAFGDYCNLYGGVSCNYADEFLFFDEAPEEPRETGAYDFAASTAESLGLGVYRTDDLDGYYAEHGTGPEIEEGTLYTNPWTIDNPAPENFVAASPTTINASDQTAYALRGIEYIYFEASNWYAASDMGLDNYLGYMETYDTSIGQGGQFMNTKHDTLAELDAYFPGRAEQHFKLYSPLLSALILVA